MPTCIKFGYLCFSLREAQEEQAFIRGHCALESLFHKKLQASEMLVRFSINMLMEHDILPICFAMKRMRKAESAGTNAYLHKRFSPSECGTCQLPKS